MKLKKSGQFVRKLSSHVHNKVQYFVVLRKFLPHEGSRINNKNVCEVMTVKASNISMK